MNKMLLPFLFFVLALNPCYSQADNTVETITIGSGNTIENAKFNALRMALEQVSGSYLSANTLVINDKLISDNITSIASGSIETYEIIDQIEKGNLYYVTIKSKVSPKKFAEFVSGKTGSSVAIKGGVYAANIKQINFNEEVELKAIKQLGDLYSELLYNSIYYDAEVMSPVEEKLLNERKNYDPYYLTFLKLPLIVTMHFTVAIDSANKYLKNNLKLICLSEAEIENYKKIKREIYPICIDGNDYFFRNKESLFSILKLNKYENNIDYINSFTINDGNKIYKRYLKKENSNFYYGQILRFTNDLTNINYISSPRRDYREYKIKGFNGEEYYIGPTENHLFFKNFRSFFKRESVVAKYSVDLLGIGYFTNCPGYGCNCIQLWESYSSCEIKLNGYYTLNEIEKINEIKILKNVSPKINYTIKTK